MGRSARRPPFYDGRRVGGCELHAQSLLLQCHPIRRSGLVTLPRFPRDEPQRSSGEACSGPAMALTRAALATDFTGRRTARDFSPYQERLSGDDAPRGLYGRFSGTVTRAVWMDHTRGDVAPALFTFVKIAPDTRLRGVGRGIPKASPNLTPKTVGFPSIREAHFFHFVNQLKPEWGRTMLSQYGRPTSRETATAVAG
jgi:hypothetical protein